MIFPAIIWTAAIEWVVSNAWGEVRRRSAAEAIPAVQPYPSASLPISGHNVSLSARVPARGIVIVGGILADVNMIYRKLSLT
jgi:hypothetical protein